MSSRTENFLPGFKELGVRQFGGALLKGNPRSARPLSTKRPMHLVMRSSKATGKRSFLHPARAQRVEKMVRRLAKLQGIKVFRFANGGDHLHMLVLPRSRKAFHNFVRSISGVAARLSLEKERGKAHGLEPKKSLRKKSKSNKEEIHFWDARPFTRIMQWGREYQLAVKGIEQSVRNQLSFWPTVVSTSSA